ARGDIGGVLVGEISVAVVFGLGLLLGEERLADVIAAGVLALPDVAGFVDEESAVVADAAVGVEQGLAAFAFGQVDGVADGVGGHVKLVVSPAAVLDADGVDVDGVAVHFAEEGLLVV